MVDSNYIERKISTHVLKAAGMYPVVTVCGPRQSGKTTLVRHLFPEYGYVNMELPHHRRAFEEDALGFMAKYPAPCIFDEVQNAPDLLSYLQDEVDRANRNGMYILTGSRQMELQETVTQSLAGRTAMVDLLPLSLEELADAGIHLSREEAILQGGLPRLHSGAQAPDMVYPDYLRTYVERDVRQIINIHKLKEFEIFLTLLAARVGQMVNFNSLANDTGVSTTTVREWLSLLEASYIIFTLYPYHRNYGKRLVKSPKVFFTETGLVASLLGLETADQVKRDPLIGNIFENLVVSEVLKSHLNKGRRPHMYFFRDSNGLEIDLIIEQQRRPKPIEIKSALTYNSALCKNLKTFSQMVPDALPPALVYGGESYGSMQGINVLSYDKACEVTNLSE